MSTMFIGLVINTGVHVVMYTYYLLVALGFTITWKKLITLIQVMQFVTSFVCVMYTVSLVSADQFECSGIEFLAFNFVFNAILLAQFIGVFKSKDKAKVVSKEKKKADKKNK